MSASARKTQQKNVEFLSLNSEGESESGDEKEPPSNISANIESDSSIHTVDTESPKKNVDLLSLGNESDVEPLTNTLGTIALVDLLSTSSENMITEMIRFNQNVLSVNSLIQDLDDVIRLWNHWIQLRKQNINS